MTPSPFLVRLVFLFLAAWSPGHAVLAEGGPELFEQPRDADSLDRQEGAYGIEVCRARDVLSGGG